MHRILDVAVINHRLDPHETELRIHVKIEDLTSTTEIRGQLVGPRCYYASTIEIAYPMREVRRDGEHIEMRVVIPEASWWEPETPYLYQGPLEFWQDGTMFVRERISHGIRILQLAAKGLKLNGQSYELRGRIVDPAITEGELKSLRDSGLNAVMTSFRTEQEWTSNINLWQLANQFGIFVLCRALDDFDVRQFEILYDVFACAFGCVAQRENTEESRIKQLLTGRNAGNKPLFGVESSQLPIPESAVFILCKAAELASMHEHTIPKIVLTDNPAQPLLARPDVIGWIESAS